MDFLGIRQRAEKMNRMLRLLSEQDLDAAAFHIHEDLGREEFVKRYEKNPKLLIDDAKARAMRSQQEKRAEKMLGMKSRAEKFAALRRRM